MLLELASSDLLVQHLGANQIGSVCVWCVRVRGQHDVTQRTQHTHTEAADRSVAVLGLGRRLGSLTFLSERVPCFAYPDLTQDRAALVWSKR